MESYQIKDKPNEDVIEPILLSARIKGIFILICLLSLVSFFILNENLIFYLISAIILALVFHSKVKIEPFLISNLKVTRELSSDSVIEGNEIIVSFKVQNFSEKKSGQIELVDTIPDKIIPMVGPGKFLFYLNPKESLRISYRIKCDEIGVFTFDSIMIISKDLLKLKTSRISISSKEIKGLQKTLTVIPKLSKFESLPIIDLWLKYYNGNFRSNHIGIDTDFRSIRDFQYGDDLRVINWKKTAKSSVVSKLYTNEFNVEKALEAELVIDSTHSAKSIWIESIREFMTLGEFLLRNRNKVGLTILKQYPEYVKPEFGKRHFKNMIHKLILEDVDEFSFEDVLPMRLDNIISKFNSHSVIIYISPLLNEFSFEFALKLKQKGFKILAITPMAISTQLYALNTDKKMESHKTKNKVLHQLTELNLAMIDKKIEARLKAENIIQIKWKTSHSLDMALRNVRLSY